MKRKKINTKFIKENADSFSNFQGQKELINKQLEKKKDIIDKYLLLN
jgi:hypothetical protein